MPEKKSTEESAQLDYQKELREIEAKENGFVDDPMAPKMPKGTFLRFARNLAIVIESFSPSSIWCLAVRGVKQFRPRSSKVSRSRDSLRIFSQTLESSRLGGLVCKDRVGGDEG
jgi:hypothetical protein